MRLLGPQYVERIEHYNSGRQLFRDFKIDEEVQKLLRPKVNLPSGGSIVIETTEALTVIDVNSGKFTGGRNLEDTIVKTNVEAAAEIARQVRLRDIGGIIVCDFIDMSSEGARNKVIATLRSGTAQGPHPHDDSIVLPARAARVHAQARRQGPRSQLRGACPTCEGIGTVMSPESVAIDAFREIRRVGHEHHNGKAEHGPIEVVSAPTVGAQIEYWYETELSTLEKELERKVAVRVDASLPPERTRIVALPDAKALPAPKVRVGDEVAVELIHARLPVATSALAIVGDRLVEVENAAGAVGQTVLIKVIDIDDEDGTILAEPTTPLAAQLSETKKRRRRGGRGRKKELTPAEQEEQLRELAEEAAKGLGGRPAIGISTSAEAEAEDVEVRTHATASPSLATVTPLRPVPDYAAVEPDGEHRAFATYGGESEVRRKRRRRRRRRAPGTGETAALAGIPVPSLAAQVASPELEDEDAAAASAIPSTVPGQPGEDGTRRRRRRRRRRGRGGAGLDGSGVAAAQAGAQPVPERYVFRTGSDGVSEGTGRTAPPEPSRAIARFDRKAAPIAVEAPPPALSLPEEPAKVTKPARGRPRKSAAAPSVPLEAARQAALPAPSEDSAAPKKRATRKKADAVEAVEAAPKKTRARKAVADVPEAAKEKPEAKGRKTPARKTAATSTRKKAATTRKKSTK